MVTQLNECIKRVQKYTMASVTPERYKHSLRTAETAVKLCRIYNEHEDKGFLAGIAHDMCKDMNGTSQVLIAQQSGYVLSEIEKKKNSLLHGRVASILLQRDFGIQENEVLEAVCFHTFGKAHMSKLAKIIYIADKIEPGRPHMTAAYFEQLIKKTLDELTFHILQENIDFLRKQKKTVALSTLEFYESLQGGVLCRKSKKVKV